uniref:Uncharacterized protein n=1 Tax=Timspurckia oligopyrenoides TaxID=708627 RepID=A0A7S1ERY6_9RHOD|mmetsp:Transcript_3062/g.5404  ORF Transcript_3062/g.5404 Transcript_3062/m.5404 type:complete len:751 (+) Transcript_3062:176-2428(+)
MNNDRNNINSHADSGLRSSFRRLSKAPGMTPTDASTVASQETKKSPPDKSSSSSTHSQFKKSISLKNVFNARPAKKSSSKQQHKRTNSSANVNNHEFDDDLRSDSELNRQRRIQSSKSSISIRGEAKSFTNHSRDSLSSSNSHPFNNHPFSTTDSAHQFNAFSAGDALPKAFPDRRASESLLSKGNMASRLGNLNLSSSSLTQSQLTLDSSPTSNDSQHIEEPSNTTEQDSCGSLSLGDQANNMGTTASEGASFGSGSLKRASSSGKVSGTLGSGTAGGFGFKAFQSVLEAMRRQRHLEEKMEEAMKMLQSALRVDSERESGCAWFIEQQGLEFLCTLLQLYTENAIIQEFGLLSVILIAGNNVSAQKRLADAGMIDVLLSMLSIDENEMTFQDRALTVLSNLLILPELRRKVADANALLYVTAVMNKYKHIGSVQTEGCSFIANLVAVPVLCDSQISRSASGTLSSVAVSMSSSGSVIPTPVQGSSEDLQVRALRDDCASVLVDALRIHGSSDVCVARACVGVRNLVYQCRLAQRAVVRVGGVDAIVKAWSVHVCSIAVSENAMIACLNIIAEEQKAKLAFDKANGIETLVDTLSKHAALCRKNSENGFDAIHGVVVAALALLHSRIRQNEKNRTKFMALNGIEYVFDVLDDSVSIELSMVTLTRSVTATSSNLSENHNESGSVVEMDTEMKRTYRRAVYRMRLCAAVLRVLVDGNSSAVQHYVMKRRSGCLLLAQALTLTQKCIAYSE